MKKIFSLLLLSLLFLTGCTSATDSKTEASTADSTTNIEGENNVTYTGEIKMIVDDRIHMESLIPEEGSDVMSFEEVVLLMNDDIPLTDVSGKSISLSELTEGQTLEVVLAENAPMTKSLPPQLPGMAIVSVQLIK